MGGIRVHVMAAGLVFACGVVAMLSLLQICIHEVRATYREEVIREITSNARILALRIADNGDNNGGGELESVVKKAAEIGQIRFFVALEDGTVAADSGIAERTPGAPDPETVRVAVPLPGGRLLHAEAGTRLFRERFWSKWPDLLVGVLVPLVALAALAALSARIIAGPLESLADAAERCARGDFSFSLPPFRTREMRMASAALHSMGQTLEARFNEINRQREAFGLVFENMTEGVLAVDKRGRVVLMNGTARNILRTGQAEGLRIGDAVKNPLLLDLIRATYEYGDQPECEIGIAGGGSGNLSPVLVHTARIRENAVGIGIVAVLRDVSRIRRLESIRRDFVANVSHELRTPVTAIQSCLETLVEEGNGDDELSAEFLEMALRNTRRLGSIIGNLLFLADLEAEPGRIAGKVRPAPLRPVVDEAVDVCRPGALAKAASIHVECGGGVMASMVAELMIHALVNLVDNAVKYGPENNVIRVSVRETGDRTEIAVADSGPGIAPDEHGRVFERFYRAAGPARGKQGVGLGLALVKHIVFAQGGEVALESAAGAGSTFRIFMPR